MPDKVIKDPDGTLRDVSTLEVVGRWFEQNGRIYYIKIDDIKNEADQASQETNEHLEQ